MKVIFIKDLKGQGRKEEIKEVKDGYAMNFLIKKGYAVPLNDKNLQTLKSNQKERNIKDKEARDLAIKEKEKLEKVVLKFKVKTGEQDRVFGSISTKQIREELNKLEYKIDKNQIDLENNLTTLGYHNVSINLYKDIKATIKVSLEK
ncbi:MAG: 50S ribosomal protein L9 [Bacilli bacterium]